MAFRYENLLIGVFVDANAPNVECTATCGATGQCQVTCGPASSCEAPSVDEQHLDEILSHAGKQELTALHEVLTTMQRHLDQHLTRANASQG